MAKDGRAVTGSPGKRLVNRGDVARYREAVEEWQRAVHGESNLTGVERLVVLSMALYINQKSGLAWPSQSTLATLNSTSGRTVKTALKKARALGYLVEEEVGGGRKSTKYSLHLPAMEGGEALDDASIGPQIETEGGTRNHPRGEAYFLTGVSGASYEPPIEPPDPTLETKTVVRSSENEPINGSFGDFIKYVSTSHGCKHVQSIWDKHGDPNGSLVQFLDAFGNNFKERRHSKNWIANFTAAVQAVLTEAEDYYELDPIAMTVNDYLYKA